MISAREKLNLEIASNIMDYDESPKYHHLRFPQKMWAMLKLRPDAVFWSSSGKSILLNYRVLDGYLLSRSSIFKTSNLSSFIRQLNLYGFRKVTSHSQDPVCNSKNPHLHEFMNEYFIPGKPELLNNIVRKPLISNRKQKLQKQCRSPCGPRLQKARRAFRMALQKVTNDLIKDQDGDDSSVIDVDDYAPLMRLRSLEKDVNEPKVKVEKISGHGSPFKTSDYILHDGSMGQSMEGYDFVTVCETVPLDSPMTMQATGDNYVNGGGLSKTYFDLPIIEMTDNAMEDGTTQENDLKPMSVNNDDQVVTLEGDEFKLRSENITKEWDQMIREISVENQSCSNDLREFYSQINQTYDIMYY